MDEAEWHSLPAMMLDLATAQPGWVLARFWRDGAWQSMLWRQFATQVAATAAGLRRLGVMPGDRVLLVSENRPEFLIADNAIMAVGAVTVPTYTTNTLADHAHVLRDCGARLAIVSTAALAATVLAAGPLETLVCMEAAPACPDGTRVVHWPALAATPADPAALIAEVAQIPRGRLACLIYTSGTGGAPKGVMLPHRALLSNTAGVRPLLAPLVRPGDCYLSFLPMSHSYEHTVGGFILPSMGMEIIFSRGAERIAAEMAQFRPVVLTAVPRLFEVLRNRIQTQSDKAGGLRARLFERALALGLRRIDGLPLGLLERAQDAVLDRLVRQKVRARFGGRLKAMVSGGARLDPDLSGFFLALGLPVIQGYGQTEAGPVIAVNLPWFNDRRTVGRPLRGVEARIAGDGELLVRGCLVMDGYWGKPDDTAQAIQGGWLHTGDVGRIDDLGRVSITDRKRDFIKLVGGDMIAPAKLEALLMAEPEIAQAVVAGEGQPGILALIVPAEGQAADAAVKRVNGKLASIERIRRWAVLDEPFTIENGLLTASMKVKRRAVLARHASALSALQK